MFSKIRFATIFAAENTIFCNSWSLTLLFQSSILINLMHVFIIHFLMRKIFKRNFFIIGSLWRNIQSRLNVDCHSPSHHNMKLEVISFENWNFSPFNRSGQTLACQTKRSPFLGHIIKPFHTKWLQILYDSMNQMHSCEWYIYVYIYLYLCIHLYGEEWKLPEKNKIEQNFWWSEIEFALIRFVFFIDIVYLCRK